jgi:DNA polymerase I
MMFLWQRFGYNLTILDDLEKFEDARSKALANKEGVIAFDTEATGLHLIKAKPFLIGFGFDKEIFIYQPTIEMNNEFYKIAKAFKYLLAHNAKFDYHMMANFGTPIPDDVNIGCTLSLARLTDYVDSMDSLSLEALGHKLVHPESKKGKDVIKAHLRELGAVRYSSIRKWVNESDLKISYSAFKQIMTSKIQHIDTEYDKEIEEVNRLFPEPNYEDSYKDKPNLMINYLADDILLVLEIYRKLINVLDAVDKNRNTWHRENKLINVVANMERGGMLVDIDYLKRSRVLVSNYRDNLYRWLWRITGEVFSSMQHQKIARYFEKRHGYLLTSTDFDSLENVLKTYKSNKVAVKVAEILLELRTLDKWLTTYIDGMLNRIYNGRVYSDINNSGTNTGRVSGDMQQQPKYALKSKRGKELFHPRRVFINDEGHTNFYIDFSNMELRVQAYYTMITSGGDFAMCRAFMPFLCSHLMTGKLYDPLVDKKEWDSGMWIDENGEPWVKLDLHSETTRKAFPEIPDNDPKFKEYYRELGKRANFTKNYGGGKKALMDNLGVTEEVANRLNNGYYAAFPKVLDYQSWVDKQINTYGFAENLFGRKYYFQDTRFSYRGYNYLIQGSCADYVKFKEIELHNFLKDYESRMVMPIHDEIVFSIKNGEEHIVSKIKEILEDADCMMPTVPMVAEVSYTEQNWADKKSYKL